MKMQSFLPAQRLRRRLIVATFSLASLTSGLFLRPALGACQISVQPYDGFSLKDLQSLLASDTASLNLPGGTVAMDALPSVGTPKGSEHLPTSSEADTAVRDLASAK